MDERDFLEALHAGRLKKTDARDFLLKLSSIGCKNCERAADKALMWCEHRAYIPSCDDCVETLIEKNSHCFDAADGGRPEAIKPISYITDKKAKSKEAGALTAAKDLVSKNKRDIAGAALGATAFAALQYLASRPKKSGAPSSQRAWAERTGPESDKRMEDLKSRGEEPGFSEELLHALGKNRVDLAKVLEKYPVRSSLMTAPLGMGAGAFLSHLSKKIVP